MSKIRIYKLAKELNISNTELVAFLEKMGFHANSHSPEQGVYSAEHGIQIHE